MTPIVTSPPPPEPLTRVVVWLTPAQRKKLDAAAVKAGKTVTQTARDLLLKGLTL